MVQGSAQLAFDGSVFFVGQPTLTMQFSHLHQHLVPLFRRILTFAKLCSDANDQPGGARQKQEQSQPGHPTGQEKPRPLPAICLPHLSSVPARSSQRIPVRARLPASETGFRMPELLDCSAVPLASPSVWLGSPSLGGTCVVRARTPSARRPSLACFRHYPKACRLRQGAVNSR